MLNEVADDQLTSTTQPGLFRTGVIRHAAEKEAYGGPFFAIAKQHRLYRYPVASCKRNSRLEYAPPNVRLRGSRHIERCSITACPRKCADRNQAASLQRYFIAIEDLLYHKQRLSRPKILPAADVRRRRDPGLRPGRSDGHFF